MSALSWPGRGRRGAHGGGGPLSGPGSRRSAPSSRSDVETADPALPRSAEAEIPPGTGRPEAVLRDAAGPGQPRTATGQAGPEDDAQDDVPRPATVRVDLTPPTEEPMAFPSEDDASESGRDGASATSAGKDATAGTPTGDPSAVPPLGPPLGPPPTAAAPPADLDPATLLPPAERIRAVLRDEPAPAAGPVVEDDLPIGKQAAAAVRALNADGRHDFPRPARRRIITIANQKGGVGKTTTTVNLAAALALHGMKVLVIDLDPQGNASTGLGGPPSSGTPSVYEVLIEQVPIADVVQPAEGVARLQCVPATIDLAGAEIELVSVVARESRLQRAIEAYCAGPGQDVDFVLVDCPPSLGLLTVNAMVATQELLIPIQCEYYALEGLGQLLKNVELVRAHLNPALHVSTILLTMYDARTRLADQVAEEVRSHFGETVLTTAIPRSVRVSEAPGYGQSVVTYDPGSRGALAYVEAAQEIARRGAEQS